MQPKTAKRKFKRRQKRTPKRRSAAAKALASRLYRRRVIRDKRRAINHALDQLGEVIFT